MRLFTAIFLPIEVSEHLQKVFEQLERSDWEYHEVRSVKWVKSENLHLTLKFLGELDEKRAIDLGGRLRSIAIRPARLFGSGLYAFPKPNRAHVLAVKVDGDVDHLRDVFNQIEHAASSVEIDRERRPFNAHITIGRSQKALRLSNDSKTVSQMFPGPALTVSKFDLVRSTLTQDGSIYEVVDSYGEVTK